MNLRVFFRHMESSVPLAEHARTKIGDCLAKYGLAAADAQVTFVVELGIYEARCHVNSHVWGVLDAGARDSHSMYAAVDKVAGKLDEQLRRLKEQSTSNRGARTGTLMTLLVLACALISPPARAETTAAVMQRVFDPMSALLATSFDREAFSAVDSRAATLARMKELQANLGAFETHMKTQNRTFQFVAESLARDVPAMIERFERGAYEEARFTLHSLTDNCIACHSSLPSDKKFPAGEAFVGKVDAAKFAPFAQAHLFVMSRQFDRALAEYEEVLSSRAVDPSVIVLLGAFTDYLRVSIEVKNDLKRPIPVLEAIKKRPSTMQHVREQLDKWIAALRQLEKDKTMEKPTLAEARKLMAAGDAQMEFVRDRDGMIHFIAAEALLTRIVNDQKTKGDQLGEAYYLLGLASDLL